MNAERNIINPNNHIKEYLSNYLILSNPEYAILLSGNWGSGKTYFIENFIDEFKNDNIKFIKISLFGLKNTNSIDEEIFQNLHPLLGSKYAKLAGNILKGALKLGVNLDWNQDGKNDGTANIDLKTFNPLDFFSENKSSKQEIVFIFDDLERTEINLKEVLGYINYLVEQ
ncbi:P-loop NTPase fold protein, partial [Sulfuricurvum sp.]|uniref:P-loop NTPase fold protein n=1 Tax=Sulfuricurvum sp. TaxID=2025608 RepID=UPI0025F9DE13